MLSLIKMAAGFFGHSGAMVADAIHSLSDLISDVIVLIMVRIAGKGKDKSHDFGHGKFETLAALIVAVLLFIVGMRLMLGGMDKIRYVINGGTLPAPHSIAVWAAILSVIAKEFLYQWTVREGKLLKSSAMIANAWHHRSDALSSIGSMLGIGSAILLGGRWTVLDPIVGCIISLFIMIVAVKMIVPAINELTDASLNEVTEKQIIELVLSVKGVENVHALKTRRSGPAIIVDMHIVVDGKISVKAAHDITILVEAAIYRQFGFDTQISIHVEPDDNAD
ncbi:MAG: cation diffusion facilitator family transporter [Paludibacteraceae bacterium]|nr:cation diffusion facilitator family transporter [Paludibacteraceae bacterium]